MLRPVGQGGFQPFYAASGSQQAGQGNAAPQQHMQQQQPQGGPPQAQPTDMQSTSGGTGAPGQEMNLANVLHYLQSEWRRWERDRNEWEIERAEMRARIALLEGQRKSAENLKVDLLRRVKMLEYALRQERTKTVSTVGRTGIPPSRLAALKDEDVSSSKDEREGSTSGDSGSSKGSEAGADLAAERGKPNGSSGPPPMGKIGPLTFRVPPDSNPWKSIGSVTKDPQTRARSREFLKQCLQEVTYLTSPGALNPLPPKPPVSLESLYPGENGNTDDEQRKAYAEAQSKLQAIGERPRKFVPDIPGPPPPSAESSKSEHPQPPPSALPQPESTGPATETADSQGEMSALLPPSQSEEPSRREIKPIPSRRSGSIGNKQTSPVRALHAADSISSDSTPSTTDASADDTDSETLLNGEPSAYDSAPLDAQRPPSSPAVQTSELPDPDQADENASSQILTAIYRPDSKAAWREELRAANEQAEKIRAERSGPPSASSSAGSEAGDDETTRSSLSYAEDEQPVQPDAVPDKQWVSKRVLRSHLDTVRAVAFAHGPGILFASAGDDCTIKVWALDSGSVMSQRASAGDIEPIATLRGHTAPITSLVVSTTLQIIISASVDSTIQVWRLPSPSRDPYDTYDPSVALQVLEGHTDAVWDLCLLNPLENPSPGKRSTENRLVSASADGTFRVWAFDPPVPKPSSESELRVEDAGHWRLARTKRIADGTPTSLSVFNMDFSKVLVGLSTGVVQAWDVEGSEKVLQWGETVANGETQVNAILSHPTLPAIITACEDGYLRFYDAKSSQKQPTHSILAHPAALTSLTLSPLSPMSLLTASTDCTVRLWDISRKTSLQELGGHRKKGGEGVTQVVGHPELPIVLTAGGDGSVRLWGT